MEKFRCNKKERKKVRKKKQGKMYVPIHICSSEHFLKWFQQTVREGRSRTISESERKTEWNDTTVQTIWGLNKWFDIMSFTTDFTYMPELLLLKI